MSRPPLPGEIHPGEVHVWHLALDGDPERRAMLASLLSEDEQARAARFHFDTDRDRWTASRGLLRQTLGNYLGVPPAAVRFEVGPFGKPSLGPHPLRFSLSHSGGRALLAVAWAREVGIDLEQMRTDFDPDALAAQVFSPEEQAWLRALPEAERHRAFLTLWTGKEAYAKARGLGLSLPLAALTLRVSSETEEIAAEDQTGIGTRLFLRRLTPAAGYAGALAAECPAPLILNC